MRIKLIILLLLLSVSLSATKYYVAPSTATPAGNDAAIGDITHPWLTWGKAFTSTSVNAGDTVYFRGGVYPMSIINGTGYSVTRVGTVTDTIKYWAYPGETPILDCGNVVPTGTTHRAILVSSNGYTHFKGLTVRNVWQVNTNVQVIAWQASEGFVTFENCTVYNIGGNGFRSGFDGIYKPPGYLDGTHYFINCDAYNCCDSISPGYAGGRGTGFGVYNEYATIDAKSYFIGCRAWHCTDQGFSLAGDSYCEADACWSFDNRHYYSGDGIGFKLGWVTDIQAGLRLVVKNCIAAFNTFLGFDTNDRQYSTISVSNIYNNIAYHNGYDPSWGVSYGFAIFNTLGTDAHELTRVFRNNIAYDNDDAEILVAAGALYTHSNNSWDIPLTIMDVDFASVDSTGITATRQADGSFPNNACYNNFLKLSATSQAINRGTDTITVSVIIDSTDFSGDEPDIGPFEWNDYDVPPPEVATVYPSIVTSGSITTGGYIIEDYDEFVAWKGICWNTTGTPTLDDNTVYGGTGSSTYSVTISGLTANVTYYVRACAVTESGTGYGATYSITMDEWNYIKHNGKIVKHNGVPVIIR